MERTFGDRVRDYRFDPYFPTNPVFAVLLALRDVVIGEG